MLGRTRIERGSTETSFIYDRKFSRWAVIDGKSGDQLYLSGLETISEIEMKMISASASRGLVVGTSRYECAEFGNNSVGLLRRFSYGSSGRTYKERTLTDDFSKHRYLFGAFEGPCK